MTPYTPQPGTIPARAIAHLKSLGEGAELATAPLCEEIGAMQAGFYSCMGPSLREGLVKVVKQPGSRLAFWALGDGKPLLGSVPQTNDEADGEEGVSTRPPATTAEQLLSAWARPAPFAPFPTATPEDMTAFDQPPEFIDSVDTEDFACALWSDGRLQLQQVGEEMVLTVEQTRQLVAYLDRMAVAA